MRTSLYLHYNKLFKSNGFIFNIFDVIQQFPSLFLIWSQFLPLNSNQETTYNDRQSLRWFLLNYMIVKAQIYSAFINLTD